MFTILNFAYPPKIMLIKISFGHLLERTNASCDLIWLSVKNNVH